MQRSKAEVPVMEPEVDAHDNTYTQKLFRGSDSYKAGELERGQDSGSQHECAQNVMKLPLD